MNYRALNIRFAVPCALLLLASCTNTSNKNHGPIVLNDSATIVTETDPDKLVDQVPDLRPASDEEQTATTGEQPKDTAQTAPAETPKPAENEPAAATPAPGNGLSIPFKEVTVFIPNIITKSFGNKNLQNAHSVTYELQHGELAGNNLRILSGTVQKITQRYQTIVALKDGNDVLPLESLGTYSSEWETLRGNGSSFQLSGLDEGQLKASNAAPAAIRNAVQQAGRRMRMNRNELADWQDFARKVRSTDQPPAMVMLRSVSWRIEGKDAKGKSFNKEVRMDMPR